MNEEAVATVTTEKLQHKSKALVKAPRDLPTRSWFYSSMSGMLFLIVGVGFSRTLYLRPWFEVPPIPFYLFVHGAVLSAWCGGLFLQALLVSTRRTSVHRFFGWVVGGVGLAVVGVSGMVTLDYVPRQRALGVDIEARLGILSQVFWTDVAALVVFSLFVAAGVLLRGR